MTEFHLSSWGPGQLLAFSGLDGATDFTNGLVLRLGEAGRIEVRHPDTSTALEFPEPTEVTFGVDWFHLDTADGPVRGAFVDTHHLLVNGPVQVRLSANGRRIAVHQADRRVLLASLGFLDDRHVSEDLDALIGARQSWAAGISETWTPPAPWHGLAVKCVQQMKGMVYGPEGQLKHRSTTPDRWPHRSVWLWDSAFHAIGYRHLDPALARDALSSVFDARLPDGQIAIAAEPFTTAVQRTQPPVLAWATELVHAREAAPEWVGESLPVLSGYLDWICQRRKVGPVFGWVEDGNEGWSVCDESGMDNSPRFSGTGVLRAIDLCCFLARDFQAMASLHESIGCDGLAWSARADELITQIESDFWNDDLGIYTDLEDADGSSTSIEAVTGFLPLILGSPSEDRVERLAAAVFDPKRFGSTLPLPTLSRRHGDLYAKDMWQGPVWINTSWLVATGFTRCGRPDVAEHIRRRTLDVMQRWQTERGCIFEFYDDDDQVPPPDLPRKGKNAPEIHPYHQVMHDFGWSATLALDWLFTETRGLSQHS